MSSVVARIAHEIPKRVPLRLAVGEHVQVSMFSSVFR